MKFSNDGKRGWLGQPHLIKSLEKSFGEEVKHMKTYQTPGTPGYSITRPKEEDENLSSEDQSVFRSGTGKLLYLVKHSRPDIYPMP